ncbi:VOC family protein [Nocardia terpenica]|nr:hypothetical protein [Nocardia terpenica]
MSPCQVCWFEFGPDGCPDGLVYSRIIDPNGNRFELFSNPGM